MRRDFLRLLGISVLVFFVIGFAMMYSRDSGFRHGISAFLRGTGGAVERGLGDLTGADRGGPQMGNTTLRIARPQQSAWLGLTGFPDETVVHFPLPHVGGYQTGELALTFDVQLAEGGDGRLTISVNGERREELVLTVGLQSLTARIPLTQADLMGDRLSLQLSARGTTNSGQICPSDSANNGVAISLRPESHLLLRSLRDLSDPETALLAAPEPLRIYLGQDIGSQTVALWATQYLQRAGVEALLSDEPLLPGQLVVTNQLDTPPIALADDGSIIVHQEPGLDRVISYHGLDTFARDLPDTWPVAVDALTSDTLARSFRGSKRWTVPYRIADLPDGLTPTRFDLALRTSILDNDYVWTVRISLNGNLLHSARLPGGNPDIALSVGLPIELQGLENALLIELIDTSPNQSICRAAPDAQAQLLPESRLSADGAQPESGWGNLVHRLAVADSVAPGSHGLLSVQQATRVAAMLAQFLPAQARESLALEQGGMTLTVLDRPALGALIAREGKAALNGAGRAWLVFGAGGDQRDGLGLYDLRAVDPEQLLAAMHLTSVIILVRDTSPQ